MADKQRRHLTDDEVEALRAMVHGRRPSPIGAWAAIIAAAATLLSAITATVVAIWDRVAP